MELLQKRIIILVIVLFSLPITSLAQNVLISKDSNATAHESAILDVQSNDKGLLIPRIANTSNIANPTNGLLVYQTDAPSGFYFYNGTSWEALKSEIDLTEIDPIIGDNTLNYISKWDGKQLISSNIYNVNSYVGIGTSNPSATLHVNGTTRLEYSLSTYGSIFFRNNSGARFFGSNGNYNTWITSTNEGNNGYIGVYDGNSILRANLSILSSGEGFVRTKGSNGEDNVRLTTLSGNSNHGFVAVQDASGDTKAGMYVNSSGQGQLFADVKNFVVDHPLDPNKQIVYASLEGPEAAMYMRGTAQLVNGKATILLPEHYRILALENTMTVMVTPLSKMSTGLAITSKSLDNGIVVEELMNGSGSYDFDWEVKCVRKGFEDFNVIIYKPGKNPGNARISSPNNMIGMPAKADSSPDNPTPPKIKSEKPKKE